MTQDISLFVRTYDPPKGLTHTVPLRILAVQLTMQVPVLAQAVRRAVIALARVHLCSQAQYAL